MSVQPTSSLSRVREWIKNNPKEIASYSMVGAVALFMIGLGALVPAMALPQAPYNAGANDYFSAFVLVTAEVGGVGGLMLTALSITAYVWSRHNHSKVVENVTAEDVRSEVRKRSLRNIAIAIGVIALFFGAGMILGSSLLKEHFVSVIKKANVWSEREWVGKASQLVDGLISAGVFSAIGGGGLLFLFGGGDWLRQKFKEKRPSDNARLDDAVTV